MTRKTLRLPITVNHRVCFFGRTGSGKSTTAKRLLRQFPRFVVLDPKHEFEMAGVPIVGNFRQSLKRQIVRVPIKDDEDENGGYFRAIDQAFKRTAHDKQPCVLYLDELLYHTNPRKLPAPLARAIRMGRSKGFAVWSASQRPMEIPGSVFTEAEHFFVGRLQYDADRDKVARFTDSRLKGVLATLRGYDSLYYNVIDDTAILMRAKSGYRSG